MSPVDADERRPGPRAQAGRPRRSKDELRRLLIEAGVQVLLDEGLGSGVEHLTFKRVYDHVRATAGIRVTNGSVIGRVWDGQEAFQREVLAAIARQSGASAIDETLAAGAAVLAGSDRSTLEGRRDALVETLRQAAAAHMATVFAAETWPPWVGVWAVSAGRAAGRERPSPLAEALVGGYEEVTARYEWQYAALLAYCGFRVRAPLTVRQLTVAAGALSEGCALRERVDAASIRGIEWPTGREGSPEPWTLFGLALVALVEQFVEPDPDWVPDGAATGG